MTEPFQNLQVAQVFDAYPAILRTRLMDLRQLVFLTASDTEGVGQLEETLKWGQPSYLISQTGSGTTICFDRHKSDPQHYGIFVHCQTSLITIYRGGGLYGDVLEYDGKRCIKFDVDVDPPLDVVRHCIELALTYHLQKRPMPFT